MIRDLRAKRLEFRSPKRVGSAGRDGVEEHVKWSLAPILRARRKDEEYVTTMEKRQTKLVTDPAIGTHRRRNR